jgi:HK97 family phage major capsid protein
VNVHGTSGTAPAGTNYVQTTELLAQALAPQTVNKVIASVDRAYRALGAKWYFNDAMLQGMRNVVDGFGRPLYTEILDDVNPMLRGYPVVVDNNVPSLAASTTGGPIFGHLASAMTYRTVKGAGLMRLEERYADFLQVGWIAHMRVDIRSNDTRAAVTVKPSTA